MDDRSEIIQDIDLQNFIFGSPTRRELIEYVPHTRESIRIGVYRNHSFELVEHTMAPYLDYAGVKAEITYSDYDDALTFFQLDKDTDMLIIWLDSRRYQMDNPAEFLRERLSYLKTIYKHPILAVILGDVAGWDESGITFYWPDKTSGLPMGQRYDSRLEQLSGTRMSSRFCMETAKILGLRYIPALVRPSLKALILDLDNTLYQGVLGEDGWQGVVLTDGHKKLQTELKSLKAQGFFLGVVSKNEQEDVLEMFRKRSDFPLHAEDFDRIICSWNDKALSISKIAQFLNIGMDSILFVDDNPGELLQARQRIPDLKCLLAKENAESTAQILEMYPGLLKIHTNFEDSVRSADAGANEERRRLRSQLDEKEYIRSLGIRLTYHIDDKALITRISELANKTNQFIFSYKRYSPAEIADLMTDPESSVVAVELSDRLSDSGIIGVCVAREKEKILTVEECFVSCRALGRGIDDLIVKGAVQIASEQLNCQNVHIMFQKGPRNLPAEKYAMVQLEKYLQVPGIWGFCFPDNLVEAYAVKENERWKIR